MNGKVCGQCYHFLAGHCWLNPPVPAASGHMMRPKVGVDERACGHFRQPVGAPVAATARAGGDVPLPSKDEAARIAAAWEDQGRLYVDRTPGPKCAPKGKKGQARV